MNLRLYYPDFVAVAGDGGHWLLETKGQENVDVARKDDAARRWCEDATRLTGMAWRYLKVRQKEFEALHPRTLVELQAIDDAKMGLFGDQ
jgi:type III restriction enzyme